MVMLAVSVIEHFDAKSCVNCGSENIRLVTKKAEELSAICCLECGIRSPVAATEIRAIDNWNQLMGVLHNALQNKSTPN